MSHCTARSGLSALLLLALLSSLGCLSKVHTVAPPCPERKLGCETLASSARAHVYIFLMDGLDPCDTANLEGLHAYLCQLGFHKTWLGHFYHVCQMEQEILCRFRCDPDARFVLIGHGTGAARLRDLTNKVCEPGVNIDLLVYLNAVGVSEDCAGRPKNARQVLNVSGKWGVACPESIPGTENLYVPEVGHFGLPTYWCVVDRIVEEIAQLAGDVPVVETVEATPIFPAEPTPRPVAAKPTTERDEWDFLKPGSLHWTGRDGWDFLKPDLVQEVLAPAPNR